MRRVVPRRFLLLIIVHLAITRPLVFRLKHGILEQFMQAVLERVFDHAKDGVPLIMQIDSPPLEVPELASKGVVALVLISDATLLCNFAPIWAEPATDHRTFAIEIDLTDRSF